MNDSENALKDMAGLLLSKATMLQYHCSKCKSPLFEKEGQIICPVCGTFDNGARKEEDKKPEGKTEGKGSKALEKKRDKLIEQLEKEGDPEKIVSIAEAIKKLEDIIGK
jgi:UPF0148 protein